MRAVWKFPLGPLNDLIDVAMPVGAEIVFVGVQHGEPMLWARVQVEAPLETRRFRVAGTGHVLADEVGPHVGSFMLHDGAIVVHVFEDSAP